MFYLIVIICLVVISVYFFGYKADSLSRTVGSHLVSNGITHETPLNQADAFDFLPIFEQLSSETTLDDSMHEITDKSLTARINGMVPQVMNLAINQKGNAVYRVVIPNGAVLDKARNMKDSLRGIYRMGGTGKIAGHANLVKVDTKIANIANVMNVASLIVGQYYMAKVDAKLEKISNKLDKVSEFQQTQFKARILALINKVGKISKFNAEVIENDELRKQNLANLSRHEDESTELLQQVNLSIGNLLLSNQKNDYKKYEENSFEFEKLTSFQQYLISVLEEIGRLTYLLNQGAVSSDFCYSTFVTYLRQSNNVRMKLSQWHENQIKHLDIQIDKNRIAKGTVERALAGMINNDWKYRELSKPLSKMIENQSQDKLKIVDRTDDLLEKDTNIILKDGKYYYLIEEKEQNLKN